MLLKCKLPVSPAGEPFNQEELEEMLSAAVDPDKGNIQYRDYVSAMALEETWDLTKPRPSSTSTILSQDLYKHLCTSIIVIEFIFVSDI